MGGESIIAAVAGALAGGGGVRALGRFIGPDRDAAIAKYYRDVIEALEKENRQLRGDLADLRKRVIALEVAQDEPPPFLA